MSMNTPQGQIVQTTPINQFLELQNFSTEQYLLAINNIAQGDGARISLQNLISSTVSSDVGNLLEIGSDGKLSVKSGAFNLDNGWLIPPTVTINWSENLLTATNGVFYFNGVQYSALSSFTVSDVPTDVGISYLYYNFSTEQFEWSDGYPVVDPTTQIANIVAVINFNDGSRFALNAWSYGGISKNLSNYLNASLGMILISGGNVTNVSVGNSSQRKPLVSQANIGLCDFNQDIPAIISENNYLQVYKNGSDLTFKSEQSEIVPLADSTNNPQYLGGGGSLTNLEADKFMNVWMVALPLADKTPYTTNYLFVVGDTQYDNLASAKAANPDNDTTISFLPTFFERFFVSVRFTLTYDGSDFNIADYANISLASGGGTGGSSGSGSSFNREPGEVVLVNASNSYVPTNMLYADGSTYSVNQFPAFYKEWLKPTGEEEKEIAYIQETSPTGITATSGWSDPNNAFDKNNQTYAICGTSTDYIEWDLGEELNIKGFTAHGQWTSSSRACNVALFSVNTEGEETLIANGTGASSTPVNYTSTATFDTVKTSKLRFKLIAGEDGEPISKSPTQIWQINITATKTIKAPTGGKLETCTFEEFNQSVAQTGECWKWGLDTATETFRVPKINDIVIRGIADSVPAKGNGMTMGFTDGENYGSMYGSGSSYAYTSWDNGLYGKSVGTVVSETTSWRNNKARGLTTDPTKSGIVAVTENALVTQTIKHFVVVATGSINQSEMDWSAWASSLANKLNTDHSNDTKPYIIETYVNGKSGYIVYSNGFCQQWGYLVEPLSSTGTISLLKNYKDTNYFVIAPIEGSDSDACFVANVTSRKTSNFKFYNNYTPYANRDIAWMAFGYIN